jgi:hypothetical protein
MTCQELIDLLHDLEANELPEANRCQVEEHLNCCLHCQTYRETYQITIRMSRRLACRPMPDTLTQRMNAVVESLRREIDPNAPRNC